MRHILNDRVRSKVIVTLKSGDSFRGILFDHDRDACVLRNTEHLGDTSTPATPVDGELVVLLADVLYMQLLG